VCNSSFHEGFFLDVLKQAIVRPRLKKPTLDPDDLASYRPISNLSFLSKVVEKTAAARITEHVEAQSLLPSRQSAYRAHHSTETAIIAVRDEIISAIDSGKVCALVLLDLSSAFDTVDHGILLHILSSRFGIHSQALDWCQSYLRQRTQTFCVGDQQSEPYVVDCSVPQGSVLGPLKFVGYTEDLAELISDHELNYHLYADDTQLIGSTSVTNVQSVVSRLEGCLVDIHQWCKSRRLQLNPSKTELIWFGSHANLQKIIAEFPSLRVVDNTVWAADSVRDLGVILDCELSMQQHVNKVAQTCFFHIRRLKQVCRLLGSDVASKLMSAFVLSRLDYCNAALAGLPSSTIAPLQRVQNTAARIVARLRPRDHVTPALQELHWLPVKQRIVYKLCLLMHLVHIGRAPLYLSQSLTTTASLHSRSHLRSASSCRYEQPRTRRKFGERAFTSAGPMHWNTLPQHLQTLTNTLTFKRHLKTFLFQQAYGV